MQDGMKSYTQKHGEENLNRKVLETSDKTDMRLSPTMCLRVFPTHRPHRESSV